MIVECRVTRDSVAMGDDIDAPHEARVTIDVPPSATDVPLHCVTQVVTNGGYLAAVAGGSTWIAYADEVPVAVVTLDRSGKPDAVHALSERALLPVLSSICLFFAYHLRNSPERLLEQLKRGRTPNRRHGDDLRR